MLWDLWNFARIPKAEVCAHASQHQHNKSKAWKYFLLTLQNALHMQQFQRFQEALALGSLFAGMLERWPRFLNAQPHVQSKSKSCLTYSLALGLLNRSGSHNNVCLPATFSMAWQPFSLSHGASRKCAMCAGD